MERINISQVIKNKSPKLAKYIPGFIIGYLRKTLHEDEINEILSTYGNLQGVPFIKAALNHMRIEFNAAGLDEIPVGGRYIFASNHPFGGLDGLMLAVLVAERFGDVRVVVNDLLMNIDPIKELFLPVNKHGKQNYGNVEAFNAAFRSDVPIVTFPAGLCSRRIGGIITDLPWRSNFIRKAVQTNREVVPVFFPGKLSNKFYRLANIRKALKLKANIEMLYLPDEMFKQCGSSFDIHFGHPIVIDPGTELFTSESACEQVRQKVYALNPLR